jgi:hypothetical protein
MKITISSLLLIISIQFAFTQNQNNYQNSIQDSLRFEKELRMADSIISYYLKHPNDTNILKKLPKNCRMWEYDGQGNVTGGSLFKSKSQKSVPRHPITLVDSLTNNYFVLDSNYIYITAYNKNNELIWKTDPYLDNKIMEYRTQRPVIISYQLRDTPKNYKDEIEDGVKVIWITYNNTQFGFINCKTGKYHMCGQD